MGVAWALPDPDLLKPFYLPSEKPSRHSPAVSWLTSPSLLTGSGLQDLLEKEHSVRLWGMRGKSLGRRKPERTGNRCLRCCFWKLQPEIPLPIFYARDSNVCLAWSWKRIFLALLKGGLIFEKPAYGLVTVAKRRKVQSGEIPFLDRSGSSYQTPNTQYSVVLLLSPIKDSASARKVC